MDYYALNSFFVFVKLESLIIILLPYPFYYIIKKSEKSQFLKRLILKYILIDSKILCNVKNKK